MFNMTKNCHRYSVSCIIYQSWKKLNVKIHHECIHYIFTGFTFAWHTNKHNKINSNPPKRVVIWHWSTINYGINQMRESCVPTTYIRLSGDEGKSEIGSQHCNNPGTNLKTQQGLRLVGKHCWLVVEGHHGFQLRVPGGWWWEIQRYQ